MRGEKLRAAVLDAVRERGSFGATVDEVATLTGRQKVSVSGRLTELERAQHLRRNGKRPGISGSPQTIWVAV
jgi:predicted transcriptional regulator